jgi:hypothetical protein
MWIELNEAEQKLARFLACKRHQANRDAGIENRRIGPQSDEQTDLEGIGAEIAFCKAHNVYPDMTLDSHPFEDAVTRQGKRVDIKSTRYQSGHLVAVLGKKEKNPPDIYALVIGVFPKYRIAGVIASGELLQDENIKDFGHGPTFAIGQNKLRNIWVDG